MPVQEMMKLQTITDDELRLSLLLAIHCAPILFDKKATNIMTVTGEDFSKIRTLLMGTDIACCCLNTRGDKRILYLYREREIMEYLHAEDIRSFLREYGYEIDTFCEMLEHLSDRLLSYSNGEAAFPHEIGIFLGYPLMDVKGFVENNGKNFICSGYWKVYTDVQNALRKFREYDMVREQAIQAVVSGKKIREITV